MRLSQQLAAARRTRYVKEHLAAELAGTAPPPLEELGLPSVLLVDRDPDRADALARRARGARRRRSRPARPRRRCGSRPTCSPDMVVIGDLDGDITVHRAAATAWPASGGWRASCASPWSQRGGDPAVRTALLESGAQDFIAEPAGAGGAARPLPPAARARGAARRAEAAEAELRRLRGITRR